MAETEQKELNPISVSIVGLCDGGQEKGDVKVVEELSGSIAEIKNEPMGEMNISVKKMSETSRRS